MSRPRQAVAAPLLDISVVVREGTPEWPGDTPYSCRWTWRIAVGDSVNVSAISASPHVGTHADAPCHVRDGAPGIDALPLSAFVGPAVVVDVRGVAGPVETEHVLARGLEIPERLLLRTGRSVAAGVFPESWPVLSEACAAALAGGGLRLLGVDAPSVDGRNSRDLRIHHVLFDAGAVIVENLDLSNVDPGAYELFAAPMLLEGLDAAPVRAFLRPVP